MTANKDRAYFVAFAVQHIKRLAGKSTSLISEGLGHGSEKETEIYLKPFENIELENADAEVCKSLNESGLKEKTDRYLFERR